MNRRRQYEPPPIDGPNAISCLRDASLFPLDVDWGVPWRVSRMSEASYAACASVAAARHALRLEGGLPREWPGEVGALMEIDP